MKQASNAEHVVAFTQEEQAWKQKPHIQTLVELLESAGFRLLAFSRNTKILVDEEVKLQAVPQKRVTYQILVRPPPYRFCSGLDTKQEVRDE